ncbi:hypothetical protein ACFQXB_12705 [Plastorhodobacter daqingensis]|uniref:Sulfotransferase family protein n=1 Tax=Plastorhodobacter daqingensis TaxID=1387281 RepID=A0ABW2UNK6_9RHOB
MSDHGGVAPQAEAGPAERFGAETLPQPRNLLAQGPLAEAIATGQARGLTVFQHINKTAGSSMVAELQRHPGNYMSLHNDYERFRDPELDYATLIPALRTEMHQVLDRALVAYQPDRVRCLSGHLYREHMDRLFALFPQAFFFTFLRAPVARVISDFRYQCTPQHPPYLAFRRACPTIEHYLDREDETDKMYEMLVGRDVPLDEGIAHIERRYALVGIHEMYPMSFNILMRCHGRDSFPRAHLRPTADLPENRVELTPALRARIEARNPRDMALYRHFHAQMLARRGEWQALRAEGSRSAARNEGP